jgi:hypothetical protein
MTENICKTCSGKGEFDIPIEICNIYNCTHNLCKAECSNNKCPDCKGSGKIEEEEKRNE